MSKIFLNNYEYFDHDADIGVRAYAKTLEEVMIQMAEGVFAIMFDLKNCVEQTSIDIDFDEADNEFALVTWLNQLIGHAREHGLVFCRFELTHDNNHWYGKAFGQPLNDKIQLGTEVKGATLTQLLVKEQNDHWIAQLVVDV